MINSARKSEDLMEKELRVMNMMDRMEKWND